MTALNEINANTATDLDKWIPEVWSKFVYLEAQSKMLWSKYIGPEGSGMPVIQKEDVFKKPGDTIRISQLANLTGDGVTGESTLQGNEEKFVIREITTSPLWYRHAVGDTENADTQINQDFRAKAKILLGNWMAQKMDNSIWAASNITAAAGFEASAATVIYGGDATSVNTIESTDEFSVETIRKVVNKLESNNIEKVGGPDGFYIILIHTFQKYSLVTDSEWITAQQEAGPDGNANPIFSNILGHFAGAVIVSTTNCPRTVNANSPTVQTARAVAMGAEALCRGMGENVIWAEQESDYNFKKGVAVNAAWEDKIMTSNALVQIVTAAVDPTA